MTLENNRKETAVCAAIEMSRGMASITSNATGMEMAMASADW